MRLKMIFVLSVILIVMSSGYSALLLTKPVVLPGETLIYEVKTGTSLTAVTSDLVARGIIDLPAWMYRL